MLGSFISRALIMVFGYVYPAYECFKVVEKRVPNIEPLLFWCRYWILVATITVCERVGDNLISWLPMYSEAKLAFFVYLWYTKSKGTGYVYDSFFRPFVSKHEKEIDRHLLELKVEGGKIALLYLQKAATYGQTKFFEILQFISSHSEPQSQSDQQDSDAKKGGRITNEHNSHSSSQSVAPVHPDPASESGNRAIEAAKCNPSPDSLQKETAPGNSDNLSGRRWRLSFKNSV